MEDLISRLVTSLGVDTGTAERIVGIVLGLFQSQGDNEQVSALMGALPGAEDLMAKVGEAGDAAGEAASGATGGLGGLISGAASMLGGGGGNPLMDTLGKLQAEGLSVDQARTAGSEIISFARENAGDEVVDGVLGSIPGLKDML